MSFRHLSYRLAQISLIVLAVSLSACGGSSSDTNGTGGVTDCTKPSVSDQSGCVYVNLADAPGDFLTYTVNVTKLTLTRSDGTVVNLLPGDTRVDFTRYSDLSEFLTLAAVPVGLYTSGSITLDYTDADIEVIDNSGNALQVAPVDSSGKPVTTMSLAITMDSQGALALAPGVPRLFQVDFDLDASNAVNLGNTTVTVQPFLVASIDPDLGNQIQVRGPLATIDTTSGNFTLGLRPLFAGTGDYGKLRVFTASSTIYNINQIAYSSSAGLTALAAAGATTAVIAKGSFNFTAHRFVATEVDAGSSVPGGALDAAEGVVLNRSGNSLVLRGTTLYRAGQTAVFRDKVTVTLGTGTKVHEAGSTDNTLDISAISVGQRLLVFGTLTDTDPSSLALDASSGFARLKLTRFDGSVASVPIISGGNTSMAVKVQLIEGRSVGLFNFAGTGTSSATDADPMNYAVTLPGDFSGIAKDDPVRVWGFVTPFGSAPPDFTGTTVADYVDANARLAMTWASPGSSNLFTSMSSTSGLVLNLASTPTPFPAVLEQGGVPTQLTKLANGAPTVQGNMLGAGTCTITMPKCAFGVYAILENGTVQLHITFAGFISDLTARLNAGGRVRGFYARGGFTGSTDTLRANEIAVIVE